MRIKVGRTNIHTRHEKNIIDHWWADCPVCPISKGFATFNTHALAFAAAFAHAKFEHEPKEFIDGH